jgi:hypothetical protein
MGVHKKRKGLGIVPVHVDDGELAARPPLLIVWVMAVTAAIGHAGIPLVEGNGVSGSANGVYRSVVGDRRAIQRNTDSSEFMNLVPAVSLRAP